MMQDQDFHFCPRGASRPRPWSRGLHHCQIPQPIAVAYYIVVALAPANLFSFRCDMHT